MTGLTNDYTIVATMLHRVRRLDKVDRCPPHCPCTVSTLDDNSKAQAARVHLGADVALSSPTILAAFLRMCKDWVGKIMESKNLTGLYGADQV